MRRIVVDTKRCEAHGDCVMAAPDVFDLDDNDTVALRREQVPDDMREQVERAARNCPVAAIRIEG